MAAGRPAIITTSSGAADLIQRFGTGATIPPADPQALAVALLPFLRDDRYADEVGQRARKAVTAELDPGKIAAKTERLYEGVRADRKLTRAVNHGGSHPIPGSSLDR